MNAKSWFLIAAVVFLATGCATSRETSINAPGKSGPQTRELNQMEGFDRAAARVPERYRVNVFPDDDPLLVIDHEPVRPLNSDPEITIKWLLPNTDAGGNASPYVFKDASDIVFLPNPSPPQPPPYQCKWINKYEIRCKYDKPANAVNWKYSIRVWKGSGTPLVVLDPWVHQP